MVVWKISPQRVWFCILIPVPKKLSWEDGMLHIKARCVICHPGIEEDQGSERLSRSYIGPCVYIPGWPQTPHDLQLLICSSQVHLQRAGIIIISRISGLFSTRDQSQGLVHVTQADHQRVPFPDTICISFVFLRQSLAM